METPSSANAPVYVWRNVRDLEKWPPSSSCQRFALEPGIPDAVAPEIDVAERRPTESGPSRPLPALPPGRKWCTFVDGIFVASVPVQIVANVLAGARALMLVVDTSSNVSRSPPQLLMDVCVTADSAIEFSEPVAAELAIRGGRIKPSLSWMGTAWPGRGCLERMKVNLAQAATDGGLEVRSLASGLQTALFLGPTRWAHAQAREPLSQTTRLICVDGSPPSDPDEPASPLPSDDDE